ncbi:EamA family transporter, partial [Xanthomonas citri pv. citri]|nr:EamA family transporter [Xanthomonas citri pv. citri]
VSTIVTMIAGFVILNESLAWYHLAGAVCIMIGVVGSNINLEKKTKRPGMPAKK